MGGQPMTGLLALALVLVGLAIITMGIGRAGNAVRAVLVLALLAYLVQYAACWLSSLRDPGKSGGGWFLLLVGAFLALLGWFLWRRRAERAKAREFWHRRHGTARLRALPSPPSMRGEDKP